MDGAQQARNLCLHFNELPIKPTYFIHDRDGKFTPQFDDILESEGVRPLKLPVRSPNLNAHAERWVKSLRAECLDHFIVFGEGHMRHIAEEYIAYHNTERPHQALGNRPLGTSADPPVASDAIEIECKSRLGGLLKHYYRKAA